jgi:glutamate-ammonia-ligase adenylyltransferase
VQHHARLNEEPTDVPLAQLAQERDAVLAVWRFVMQ